MKSVEFSYAWNGFTLEVTAFYSGSFVRATRDGPAEYPQIEDMEITLEGKPFDAEGVCFLSPSPVYHWDVLKDIPVDESGKKSLTNRYVPGGYVKGSFTKRQAMEVSDLEEAIREEAMEVILREERDYR